MSRTIFVLAASTLMLQQSWGQRRGTPAGEFNFLFFEPVNRVSTDSTKSRIDIQYRIDHEFFIQTRNSSPSFPWQFKRRGDIVIELLDSLGESKAREIEHAEMGSNDAEPGDARQWYQGIASFNVAPGLYKVVFEIDDLESERKHVNRDATIRAKRFARGSMETSTPIFIDWAGGSEQPDSIVSQNFGENLLFGSKSALYFELPEAGSPDSVVSVSYTISTSAWAQGKPEPVSSDSLAKYIHLKSYSLEPNQGNGTVTYRLTPSTPGRISGFILPLASEKLPLRSFDIHLVLKRGKSETKLSKNFRMVWPEMPLSLRDIDYALESLRFITTEKQLDSLKRGNLDHRRDNLEAFWKARDRTPETAYNEVMTEYYHRVDYARKNFGTFRELDGLKSDRGRIYVLYGAPTRTSRNLSPDTGYQEIWSYEAINKKFVFADQNKSGNYILVSTQPL